MGWMAGVQVPGVRASLYGSRVAQPNTAVAKKARKGA
jgi:hypothetical protein